MAKPEQLKKGVEVWIKQPLHIYAEIIGPRPGDAGLPPEEVNYEVKILPTTQYLPADHMELANPPRDPNARLESMSPEWTQELAHCHDLMLRSLENQADKNLAMEVAKSLAKLGFMVERQ